MTSDEKIYVESLIRSDLSNIRDNLIRAEAHQKRFPYDHDNNDFIVRHEQAEIRADRALRSFREAV